MKAKAYAAELGKLEFELAKLQETVGRTGARAAIIFEGRDAAGKSGLLKTITRRMNARIWRVVALPKPSDVERGQWYFQRYVAQLPSAGEIALFDRSWYNRAIVEPVMGFCAPEEHEAFLREAPEFERMLVDGGLRLIKFWFHISAEQQEKRFQERACDPRKRWKLSAIDLEGRRRWAEFSLFRDRMLEKTHTDHAPWRVIDGDDKRKARLNCIRAILDIMPYDYNEEAFRPVELPPRQTAEEAGYEQSDIEKKLMTKDYYADGRAP